MPLCAALAIVLWICLQRYFDAIDKNESTQPIAHKRPSGQHLCIMTGYVCAAYSQMFIPRAASRIAEVAMPMKLLIAVIFALCLVFVFVAKFTATEWWSIGLELSASAMVAIAGTAYGISYLTLGEHPSTFGALMSFGMSAGGALRAFQLVRLIGR